MTLRTKEGQDRTLFPKCPSLSLTESETTWTWYAWDWQLEDLEPHLLCLREGCVG
jgi:hypothetical protein